MGIPNAAAFGSAIVRPPLFGGFKGKTTRKPSRSYYSPIKPASALEAPSALGDPVSNKGGGELGTS